MTTNMINKKIEKMSTLRKHFIAGAVCAHCQTQDTLVVWRQDRVDIAECIACGYQIRQVEADVALHLRPNEEVIGILQPK